MDRMNDSEVFNYIDSKFHSADYGTSYVDEDWYKADEVDARIQELEEEMEAMRDGDITHFTEWHIQVDEIYRLRKALEEIQERIAKGDIFGWTPREILKWVSKRTTEALKDSK